jgi:beta-lactamase class A
LLTSCDGTIGKQINWLEDFTGTKNHDKAKTWSEMILKPFLRSYSAAVEASMAMISISYDIASNLLERVIRK